MTILYLTLDETERLDVVSTVVALKDAFPETKVVAEDSFEAERQRTTISIAEIAAEGMPLRNPEVIIQRITNKEMAMGPGVDVLVPIGVSSVLSGHVWAKHIMLASDNSLQAQDIELVRIFLKSLQVGKVEVVG